MEPLENSGPGPAGCQGGLHAGSMPGGEAAVGTGHPGRAGVRPAAPAPPSTCGGRPSPSSSPQRPASQGVTLSLEARPPGSLPQPGPRSTLPSVRLAGRVTVG